MKLAPTRTVRLALSAFAIIVRAITLRAQITNMREVRAGNLKLHRRGPGRKEKRIKLALLAIGELDKLVPRIDRLDPCLQQQFDLVLFVEILGAERNLFFAHASVKKVLRQRWTIVGNAVVRAEQGQLAVISFTPQHFGRGVPGRTAAHDDDGMVPSASLLREIPRARSGPVSSFFSAIVRSF
jgi:hypothetical protein